MHTNMQYVHSCVRACTHLCVDLHEGFGRSCIVQHAKDRGYGVDSVCGDDSWMHVPYWVRCLRLIVMMAAMVMAGTIVDDDSDDNDDGDDDDDANCGGQQHFSHQKPQYARI